MTSADRAFERAAGKLDELASEAEEKGGVTEKLAPKLADDADFLRKMEPSKVAQRVRGERSPEPARAEPKRRDKRPGTVAALAPVGAAFGLGILIAKLVDWRSHAEPRL